MLDDTAVSLTNRIHSVLDSRSRASLEHQPLRSRHAALLRIFHFLKHNLKGGEHTDPEGHEDGCAAGHYPGVVLLQAELGRSGAERLGRRNGKYAIFEGDKVQRGSGRGCEDQEVWVRVLMCV